MSRAVEVQLTSEGVVKLHQLGRSILGDGVQLVEIGRDYAECCRDERDAITYAAACSYTTHLTDFMKAAGQHVARIPV